MTPSHPARQQARRQQIRLALAVVRWTLRFYREHLVLVMGLSLIASAQRATAQLWGDQLPAWSGPAGEALTGLVRVVLFVAVLRIAILGDEHVRRALDDDGWRRIRAFARHAWPSLGVQLLLFAALFTVVDIIPDLVIAPRVPAPAQPAYWAALLAVKNPTVIALSMIWQIGAARQALLLGGAARAQRAGAAVEAPAPR